MICKGTTHNDGAKLAAYMTTGKRGERAELWQMRGFEAIDIKDAFRDVQIMAGATKCEQPFFHVQVRNREGESLSRQEWEQTADRIERMMGLGGQARAITFHTYLHSNDEHMHVAWSRIDEETLTAKSLPFFKERLKKLSRELELHFALEPVTNQREGHIRYGPTRAEQEQARRLGLDGHKVRNTIRDCFDRSDCGTSFQAALEQEGMILAQGERRDFVVIDQAGGMHALGKRILDVTAAKLRHRFSDLSRDELPCVESARILMQEQGLAKSREELGQEGKKEEVWDREAADRAWQESVIQEAIAKEKRERNFAEPAPKDAPKPEREKVATNERALDDNAAAIRLAYALCESPATFARNLEDCGFRLACVTKEEAERSHRKASFAREIGRFSPEYREGEFVAISEKGYVYGLNQRTTGESRAEVRAFMSTADKSKIEGIEATQETIATFKRPAPSRDLWNEDFGTVWQSFDRVAREMRGREKVPNHIKGDRSQIWEAYIRSDHAKAFVAALQDRGITVACVSRDDVANSQIAHHYATDLSKQLPKNLKEGEFVAVAENGRVYNLNRGTTGASAAHMQAFMASLDKKQFANVHATLKSIDERAALKDIERQAFRDLTRGHLKREPDARPKLRKGRQLRHSAAMSLESVLSSGRKGTRIAGKSLDMVGDALASLLAPVLTPEQKATGEKAQGRREAEAENAIDLSKYTSEMAQQRQLRENEQEAERRHHTEHERGGRER